MQNGSFGEVLPPPLELGPQLSNPPAPTAAGLAASNRIEAFDVARAIAVLGMILVNGWQILLRARSGPQWFTGPADFLYGRPAVLFVVLAGVGLSLMARRAIASGDQKKLTEVRAGLFKRSIMLFAMGLVFKHWWGADILHFYGVYLSIGALCLTVSGRNLWKIIAIMLLASGFLFVLQDNTPPKLQNFLSNGGVLGQLADDLCFDGNYPVVPWLLFLLIGLWLGRQETLSNAATQRLLWKAALLSLVGSEFVGWLVPSVLYGPLGFREEGFVGMLFMLNSFPMTPLFVISSVSGATLILLFALTKPLSLFPAPLWRILQNTGKLSLSIYIIHIFFFLWLDSWLPARCGPQALPALAITMIVFCVCASLTLAEAWSRYFNRGPFEWLLRWTAAHLW